MEYDRDTIGIKPLPHSQLSLFISNTTGVGIYILYIILVRWVYKPANIAEGPDMVKILHLSIKSYER